jgi:hypothetical protein
VREESTGGGWEFVIQDRVSNPAAVALNETWGGGQGLVLEQPIRKMTAVDATVVAIALLGSVSLVSDQRPNTRIQRAMELGLVFVLEVP